MRTAAVRATATSAASEERGCQESCESDRGELPFHDGLRRRSATTGRFATRFGGYETIFEPLCFMRSGADAHSVLLSPSPGFSSRRPDHLDLVPQKLIVRRHDREILYLSLRDQEAVERIAMMWGQTCDLASVVMQNRKPCDWLMIKDVEQGIAIDRRNSQLSEC